MPEIFYCIGARTGVLIRPAAAEHQGAPFDQWRLFIPGSDNLDRIKDAPLTPLV